MLRQWLKNVGISREEFALICNVSKRTVDGWCSESRNIPPIAQLLIHRIMREQSAKELKFNFEDWQKINYAMSVSGYTDFYEFATDAIKSHFENSQTLMAAEEPIPYNPIPEVSDNDEKKETSSESEIIKFKKAAKREAQEKRADKDFEEERKRLIQEEEQEIEKLKKDQGKTG